MKSFILFRQILLLIGFIVLPYILFAGPVIQGPAVPAMYWRSMTGASIFFTGGNVGIGTAIPDEKLHVEGNIKAYLYYHFSDRRLKENIIPLQSSLEKVLSLTGYSFDWRNNGKHDIGVIAQEVETVFPNLVATDTHTGFKSVEYSNLVAPIIEAIKELNNSLKSFKDEIVSLQNENKALRQENDSFRMRLDVLEKKLNKIK